MSPREILQKAIDESGRTSMKQWYNEVYLYSEHWKALRHKKMRSTRFMCQDCGTKNHLQVHHENYRDIFNVTLNDLRTLCRRCHQIEHFGAADPRDEKRKPTPSKHGKNKHRDNGNVQIQAKPRDVPQEKLDKCNYALLPVEAQRILKHFLSVAPSLKTSGIGWAINRSVEEFTKLKFSQRTILTLRAAKSSKSGKRARIELQRMTTPAINAINAHIESVHARFNGTTSRTG